jgi:hypothetical protein
MAAVRAQLLPPGNIHEGYELQPAPGLVCRRRAKGSVRRHRCGEARAVIAPQEIPLPAHHTVESAGSLPRVEGQKMAKRTTSFIPIRRGYPSSNA